MMPGGSLPRLQGLSNNRYPEPNQPNSSYWFFLRSILILSSHLRLDFPKGLFPVGEPIRILKALPFFHTGYFCICFEGVEIAAQCTATFSDLLCSHEFRYY